MKTKYLLPTWVHIIGYFLAIPGFILGYLNLFKGYKIPGFGFRMREKDAFFQRAFENFTNELVIFMVVIGLLLIAFSKSEKEDELNAKLRLNSLLWAILTYNVIYILIFSVHIFLTEVDFLSQHYLEYNIFTPLLIFIARFNYLRHIKKDVYLIDKPFLLPNRPTKKIGIITTVFSLAIIILVAVIDLKGDGFDKLLYFLYLSFIIGLLLWAFSKQKIEDEMISNQRLESLQLAVYFNYSLLLIATLLFYSLDFLNVLAIASFSLLLFFVIRMEYVNYKNTRLLNTFEGEALS